MTSDSDTPAIADRRCLRMVVHGRVQGVGFREFVRRTAIGLRLDGWVRNLPDGRSVELVACGDRTGLKRLMERAGVGPHLAYVTGTEHEWMDATVEAGGFAIRY